MRTPFFSFFAALVVGMASPQAKAQTGTVDSFNPEAEWNVYGTAVQADGKVLVCGPFIEIGGISRPAGVARLHPDGSVDMGFNPAITGGTLQVYAVAALPDGRVLLAGSFHGIGPYPIRQVARLNTDGSVDAIFSANPDGFSVSQVVPMMNGKTMILGDFTTLGSGATARQRLARLNTDGSVDATFVPPSNTGLNCVAVLPDGKVMVGTTATINGTPRSLARLNSDGSLDATFADPGIIGGVYRLIVQPDGKMLINSGNKRLNADGTPDSSYLVSFNSVGYTNSFALQANGSVLLAGEFTHLQSQPRQNIGRVLNTGGSDGSFIPSTTGIFWCSALQGDGRVIVGGNFQHDTLPYNLISGVQRGYIARLYNDGAINAITVTSPTTLTWMRGGTAPEATEVRFEVSTNDGTTWTAIGGGTRITDGWEWSGAALPLTGIVRGQAIVPVLHYSGQSSSVISSSKPYAFAPAAQVATLPATNAAITSATLNATINPNGSATTASFQYGTTTAYGSTLPIALVPDNGSTPLSVSLPVSGLSAHVMMHYRVVATNAIGTSYGEDVSFVLNATPPAPVLSSNSITENNASNAVIGTLGSTSDADGDAITYSLVTGMGDTDNLSFTIVGNTLQANYGFDYEMQTSYSVRIRASDGFPNGDAEAVLTITVTNIVEQPIVITMAASNVRHSSAALNAQVNPNTQFTTVQFEWGPTPSYGNVASVLFFGHMDDSAHDAQTYIGGLSIGGTYHYRVMATNSEGTTPGTDQTFTTRATSPGDVDLGFNPDVLGIVQCTATQPDGKVLIGGSFSQVNGVERNNLARLNADGTLDLTFNPNPDDVVNCVAVLSNERIVIGGAFTHLGAASANHLARVMPYGTVDTSFTPLLNGEVTALHANAPGGGKLYISGSFTTVSGAPRGGFARLLNSGLLDTTLDDMAPNGPVLCMAQYDENEGIIVGGSFSSFGGNIQHGLARINNAHLVMGGFYGLVFADPGTTVSSLQRVQNALLVGGSFATFGGAAHENIARIVIDDRDLPIGATSNRPFVDTAFNPSVTGLVNSMATQSNGNVIIGGDFSEVNGTAVSDLARITTNGVLDTTFDPGLRGTGFLLTSARGVSLQLDGRVLVCGSFTHFGGEPRRGLGLLRNGLASQVLSSVFVAPSSWTGILNFGGTTPALSPKPELSFLPSPGTVTSFSGEAHYGAYSSGGGGETWSQVSSFLTSSSATQRMAWGRIAGGSSTVFISVPWICQSLEEWRALHMGSTSGVGASADTADFDGDGVVNLLEYAFGTSPRAPTSRSLPEGIAVPDGLGSEYFEIRFTQSAGITGITYGAEWSATLIGASWTPVPDTGVLPEHVFRIPITGGTRGFMRVVVTRTP